MTATSSARLRLLLAAGWGVAEGFLFFVVPDVLISFIAQRRGWRPAVAVSIAAALGAVLGVLLLWQWSVADPATVPALIEALPAIDTAMIDALRDQLATQPLLPTLLVASIVGVPIKIAAMLGPSLDLSLTEFLLTTPLARLPRFLAIGLGAALLAHVSRRWLSADKVTLLLALVWIVFYGVFWLL